MFSATDSGFKLKLSHFKHIMTNFKKTILCSDFSGKRIFYIFIYLSFASTLAQGSRNDLRSHISASYHCV